MFSISPCENTRLPLYYLDYQKGVSLEIIIKALFDINRETKSLVAKL